MVVRDIQLTEIKAAFFWDYSGYSYSGLRITEYTEFQFPKERLFILKPEYSWRSWTENYFVFQPEARRATPGGRFGNPAKNFPKERVFCIFRVNRIPFILFILLSGAE